MSTSAGAAAAAPEELGAAVSGAPEGAQAAIVIVSRDPGTREILHRELAKRYGGDYQIVACGQAGELGAWMRDLRAAGLPVALVIGGVGAHDRDGIEVLAAVRAIDPRAVRVAAVGWGDWQSVRPVFDAVTLGTVDHWVFRPVQAPDEEFHRMITEFLREWSSQRGGFEAVQVIGERWSARSRSCVTCSPATGSRPAFLHAASGPSGQMLHDLGLAGPELPVVVVQVHRRADGARQPLQPADRRRLRRHDTDLARRGLRRGGGPAPARPGSLPRSARPPKAFRPWSSNRKPSAARPGPAQ